MIAGMLAFLLAAVLILLLIPIRYTVTLVRWRLTLSVSVLEEGFDDAGTG